MSKWQRGRRLKMSRKPNKRERFAAALTAHGAEVLAPTNPYEVMRFRTRYGTGVIYRNAQNRENWNEAAIAAREHLDKQKGPLGAVKVVGRKRSAGTVNRLRERDGDSCFFCRAPLADDVSIEHLVSIAHGGPNHISNLFLAHVGCNARAGHLSAPEKIAMRDSWLSAHEHEERAAA